MLKKVMIILTVVLVSVLSAITVSANNISYETEEIDWTESGIKMAVDGKEITFPDQKPLLDGKAGRTYIPIRFLAEALGAEVEWDNENQVVIIVNKGIEGENTKNIYYLKIGSNKIVWARYANGGNIATSVAVFYMPENIRPLLEGGRTVIPFRYIAELMGSQVYYDPTTGTANCVKRDMSSYKSSQRNGAVPVLNSLIGEYFIDELNQYRAKYELKPVTLNGDFSDMMTWAAFDQITHPGQRAYYQQHFPGTELHLFSWNRNTDINSRLQNNETTSQEQMDYDVWHVGAYYQYIRTYLPNHPEYSKLNRDKKMELFNTYNYGENAFQMTSLLTRYITDYDLSAEIYEELTKNWGLNVRVRPDYIRDPHENIIVYNEATMRNISKDAINVWHNSSGHRYMMQSNTLNRVGFATVGEFTYMCGLR